MPNSPAETVSNAATGLIAGAFRATWHVAKQVVMQGVAWSLIISGLIVPFVPVPVAVVGGYMLARNSASTRRFLAKQRIRWPAAFDGAIDFTSTFSPRFSEDIDRLTGIEHLVRQKRQGGTGPSDVAEAVISPLASLSLQVEGRRIGFSAFRPRAYVQRGQEQRMENRAASGQTGEKSMEANPRHHIRRGLECSDPAKWRPARRGPQDGDEIIRRLRERGYRP